MAGVTMGDRELLQEAAAGAVAAAPRTRPPSGWAVGWTEDAIAVASALQGAARAVRPRHSSNCQFQVALSPTRRMSGPARRVPDRSLLDHVLIGRPTSTLDLVAVRPGRDCRRHVDTAAGPLRPGGYLVLVGVAGPGGPGEELTTTDGLEPVGTSSRLFVKRSTITRLPGEDPAGATDEALGIVDGPGPVTLAEYEFQMSLVTSHYGLARALAGRFSGRGQSRDDLEQVAFLALVKAARRFRPDRQAAFASFATATVLGEIKRHFRDKAWAVRAPRSVQERYLNVRAANEELSQKYGRSPSISQIAEHLELTDDEVVAAMDAAANFTPLSLDAPVSENGGSGTDIGVEDEAIETNLSLRELRDQLGQLAPSERLLIEQVYFQGWSQRKVAERLGVSQMQVSRMVASVLAKLRTAMAAA